MSIEQLKHYRQGSGSEGSETSPSEARVSGRNRSAAAVPEGQGGEEKEGGIPRPPQGGQETLGAQGEGGRFRRREWMPGGMSCAPSH